jgi:hypothetical protein
VLLTLAGLAALSCAASAATRHLTWLLGVGGLLVLPLLSDVLPSWRVLPAWTSSFTSAGMGLGAFEPPSAKASIAVPLTRTVPERAFSDGPSRSPMPSPAHRSELSRFFAGLTPSRRALWLGLMVVWTAGAALLTFRLIACLMWLRVSTRGAEAVSEGPLAEALAGACEELGVCRPVKLFLTKRGIVPLVWGIFIHLGCLRARTWEVAHAVLPTNSRRTATCLVVADMPPAFIGSIRCPHAALHVEREGR